eukprot:CAMPEP_0194582558 /NCGR_PEP_ID=MMETSP0292-20121207/15699_1 /TAXON_ID=39354 /ORGANISM="Heterosigma akashiwo, Strain CCMP2393" /LENGTH=151 /DNA_ID=CAMNT_0039436779 /DNA_START=18 /DNA_END=469 /DNA_ORIENTATION=-
MDFKGGGDLYTLLCRNQLSAAGAAFYAAEALLGLRHLHDLRVVYRDLKPENVLVCHDGHVCLGDLGLAKHRRDARTGGWRACRTLCGTDSYVAPETLRRDRYGPSADVWQFGCFVFELFAGRSPFFGAADEDPRAARRAALEGRWDCPEGL